MKTHAQEKPVVLVTGASSGLGKDFCIKLLDEGYTVVAAARRIERMEDLKDLGADTFKFDITNEDDIVALVAHVKSRHGRLDVLINNAGYGEYGAVETVPLDAARYQFEVNLFGLSSLTTKAIPIMREQGKGRIINISSIGGRVYSPLGAWYYASKHALEAWSDCLRFELKPQGIDVVIIEPGLIATEFGEVVAPLLIKRGKDTPYEELTNKNIAMFKETEEKSLSSPPAVITKLVMRAIQAKKPRMRYVGGKYGKASLFMRRYLGDVAYEDILTGMLKKY